MPHIAHGESALTVSCCRLLDWFMFVFGVIVPVMKEMYAELKREIYTASLSSTF